jgi:hypothetical protein
VLNAGAAMLKTPLTATQRFLPVNWGQEKDVRRFIVEHPNDIDLRKVDQLGFLDVITNGLLRAA